MAQYVDKSALVVEIEKLMEEVNPTKDKVGIVGCSNVIKYLQKLLSAIDTLEMKEVDLKKDFELTWEDVAWIVNKAILQCKNESTLTAEDICKDVLKQFKDYKGG